MENKIKDLVDRISNAAWLAGYHMARDNSTSAAQFEATQQTHIKELLALVTAPPIPTPPVEDGEENYDGFDELFDAP